MTRFETERGQVELRELRSMDEIIQAEQIQIRVWGKDVIPHPKDLLLPVQHEGGLLAGAFSQDGDLVGLVFGFPTHEPLAMHSQLLATLEEWRGQGIGTKLKWFQRQWCLEHDYRLVRWTVDPLRAANAELNFRNLGCVASRYLPDYYGALPGIDAGAPTDRILIDWYLDSERVCSRETGPTEDIGFPEAEVLLETSGELPIQVREKPSAHCLLVRLPGNFIRLSQTDPQLALRWREITRALLQVCFNNGYQITGFTRVGGPAYLLEKE